MNAWKKRGAALMLTGVAVLIGTILTACDSTAAPEKIAPPAPQGVPSEPEKEPKQSTLDGKPSNSPAEESGQSSQAVPAEDVPEPSPMEPPSEPAEVQEGSSDENIQEATEMKLKVEAGEQAFSATLEENAAVDALVELLRQGPLTLQLHDYSGFEKVGPLGASLPAEDRQTTTQAGDIVLYTGDQIVIFYGSNSWRYTRLGHIDDLTGWEEALGSGDVTVRLSLKG